MMLLNEDAVYRAAHVIWSDNYAREAESGWGLRVGEPQQNICDYVPKLEDAQHAQIVWRIIGKLEGMMGVDMGLLFHHAGIETEFDTYDCLSDWLLQIAGHGVENEWEEALEQALFKLGKPGVLPKLYHEFSEYSDLAMEALTKLHGPRTEEE